MYNITLGCIFPNEGLFKCQRKDTVERKIPTDKGKEGGKLARKMKRSLDESTHGNLIHFGDHRCLSQSEESK